MPINVGSAYFIGDTSKNIELIYKIGGTFKLAISGHIRVAANNEKRNPAEIEHFLNEKMPMIRQYAKRINADIGFEDEAGVGVMTRSGRTWGMVGNTPMLLVSMQRGGYNVLSAITAEGKLAQV